MGTKMHQPTLIDVDTHYIALSTLEELCRVYPSIFAMDRRGQHGEFRFFAHDRLLILSRVSSQSVAATREHRLPGQISLQTKLEDLDQESPDAVQVLGFAQGICGTRWPPAVGVDVARALNDGILRELAEFPAADRFIPVAAIYPPCVAESVREIERTAKLGFRGIYLGPVMAPFADLSLGSESMWPIYEAVTELNLPILIHYADKTWRDWASYDWRKVWLPNLVGVHHPAFQRVGADLGPLYGFPFTYACDMADLIFSGTLDRFPTLRIAFLEGRLPSYIPALMDALDQVRPRDLPRMPARRPSEYFTQFYPAATANERHLGYTVRAWPDHTIVVGSDYPHTDVSGTWPNTIKMIRSNADLSEVDKDRILFGNAMRLFAWS
jgi:aminocarboxymuconate-semialdehyde decarboxylase